MQRAVQLQKKESTERSRRQVPARKHSGGKVPKKNFGGGPNTARFEAGEGKEAETKHLGLTQREETAERPKMNPKIFRQRKENADTAAPLTSK